MCGRFALAISPTMLAKLFELNDIPSLEPRYNIAPGQSVAAILGDITARRLTFVRWGLIPSWAVQNLPSGGMINARSETAADRPVFREAFRQRRCLIPASGFYEWQKQGSCKQPFYFTLRDDQPMVLAGLWEPWTDPTGQPIATCAILTTGANALMRPIHDRMPVIVPRAGWMDWMDHSSFNSQRLMELLKPYPAEGMALRSVSPRVNRPGQEGPECIADVDGPALLF